MIIGAGIAGASCAAFLAPDHRVCLLEREAQPGYHSTGRSAAVFEETYGPPVMRALTRASRGFFKADHGDLVEAPVLSPLGTLIIGTADQRDALDKALELTREVVPGAELLSPEAAARIVPVLRTERLAGAVHETASEAIDVHGLHRLYLRMAARAGAATITDAEVTALTPEAGGWTVSTSAGTVRTAVVVNAAGAWADAIAAMAGVAPIGLVPKRRTAITLDPVTADGPVAGTETWPIVLDADEQFYLKPEGGRLLASPADATPMPPCDIQPDELDIAIVADRIMAATTLKVDRIRSSWAGLRSFVADGSPVAGFAQEAPGFFWLAGQGGYGIQSSAGLGRTAAALVRRQPIPDDVAAQGVTEAALRPDRPSLADRSETTPSPIAPSSTAPASTAPPGTPSRAAPLATPAVVSAVAGAE